MSNNNSTNNEDGIDNDAGIIGSENSAGERPPVPGDESPGPIPDDESPGPVPGDDEPPPAVPGNGAAGEGNADKEGEAPREKARNSAETPDQPVRSTLGEFTPYMLQWLTDNREDYEFYMLHAMMHDPLRRISLLTVPVTPNDIRREEYTLVIRALETSSKIMGIIGQTLTNPPTVEFLRTYIESAGRELSSDDEMIEEAVKLAKELQDPSYCDQHYCVGPYFQAWYGSMQAKKVARKFMEVDVPDVDGLLEWLRVALDAASEISNSLDDCSFDFDSPPEPPDPILKLGDHIISTAGNIANIQGPPKAAKSAVVGAILASTVVQTWTPADTLGFTAERPAGRAVVHFDTEQSDHAHDALMRRVYSRSHQHEKVNWLKSYNLTGMEPAMCWKFLEGKLKAAAEEHGGIMMVIIDGIADFCNDPNDGEECFGLVRKLHRFAAKYECVFLTVLHENPGSSYGKTRGHLGSHLERKAETSLRVKKDPKNGISTIWAESARHCFIPHNAGWRFHWCDDAKMHVSLRGDGEAVRDTKPDKRAKYANEVAKAFDEEKTLRFTPLKSRIMKATKLADSTVRVRIREYLALKLLEKDADEKYRIVRAQSPA